MYIVGMVDFAVAQSALLGPFIDVLNDAGAPVGRLLAQSGLDRFNVDDPNALIPAACLHDFIDIVARRETGSSLPKEVMSRYVLANMGGYGAEALACSDLRTLSLAAADPEARQLSYETVSLDVRGARSEVSDTLALPPGLARSWLERLTICLIVDGCRAAGGADWTPAEIHLTDGDDAALEMFVSDETIVYPKASKIAVVFPTTMLARPLRPNGNTTAEASLAARIENTAAARVDALLDSWVGYPFPTLERISDLSGITVRTLQRRLKNEGTSYFEIIDRWRCRQALQMISNPDISVGMISEQLSYSDTAHFNRAFRRWTGEGPKYFRESLSQNS